MVFIHKLFNVQAARHALAFWVEEMMAPIRLW
jgi:hypothetical protein